jgi:hypothetical protein
VRPLPVLFQKLGELFVEDFGAVQSVLSLNFVVIVAVMLRMCHLDPLKSSLLIGEADFVVVLD